MDIVSTLISRHRQPKRFAIICDQCNHVHTLENDYTEAKMVYLICHGCETPLRTEITLFDLLRKYG